MVRSLYSGVSGLTAHQTRMDVIGNNIANVNTYGFKASRTSFSDVYYQTKQSATGGSAVFAGNNQSAVGYGTQVSSIDKDMSTSSFQTTSRTLDLAIAGDGFFVTGTLDSLGDVENVTYTRYGNFGIDSEGNLVNSVNRFVLGTVNNGDFSSKELAAKVPAENPAELDIINVNDLVWEAFKRYCQQDYADVPNEYKTDDATMGYTKTIYSHTDPYDDTKTIAYDVTLKDTAPEYLTDKNLPFADGKYTEGEYQVASDYILYEVDGKYVNTQGVTYDPEAGNYVDEEGNHYSYKANTVVDDNGNVSKIYQYTLLQKDETSGEYTATTTVYEYKPDSKTFEAKDALGNTIFADMKMNSITTSLLDGFSVGKDGVLTAQYANEVKALARIELATFDNPEGLDQLGDSDFGESVASGGVKIRTPGSSGTGQIKSTKLEMSNVNLANEFSDMIVTQRGFQANARIITTSDSMLEELVNLKR